MTDWIKSFVEKNWRQYAIYAAMCVISFLSGKGCTTPPPMPVFNPDAVIVGQPPQQTAFGWLPDPEAVKAIVAKLPFKAFGDTPAGEVDAPLPEKVYLWEAYRKADPRGPPIKNQGSVGSCVSFGTNQAIIRTMAMQIVLKGLNEELKDIAEEVTYAGSRVEIGGGRIRGDGSVGAWAAQFVQKFGVISRAVHGKYDLTKYDQARCRSWGSSGVPNDLELTVKEHPVKEITQIRNWEEAKRALSQGYGIAVCSDQGFSMQRDSRGVARASGEWMHCMCLDGYHVEGGKEFGHIQNSWGATAHTGPVGWGNPDTGGFWAEASVVDRMLRQGDSWAFSSVKGFPANQIDWFVMHKQSDRSYANAIRGNGRHRLDKPFALAL